MRKKRKERGENKCESKVSVSKVINSSNFVGVRGTWPSPNSIDNVTKEQNDGSRK